MTDPSFQADGPTARPPVPQRRAARWPWVLGVAVLLLAALLAIGTLTAWTLISETVGEGVAIVVNGHRWEDLHPEHALGALAGIGVAGMALVGMLLLGVGLVVPLVLALILLIVGLAVALVLGVAGVALAAALSPLWLPLLLLWWLLRPSRRRLASSTA